MKNNKKIVIAVVIVILAFLCPYRVIWETEETAYADLPNRHVKALF